MKTRIRSGIQSVCIVLPIGMLALGTNAFGQSIRWMPIRSAPLGSPAGTVGDPVTSQFNADLGCWEYSAFAGDFEIHLDLQAFGWGDADGSPTLGQIQATVEPGGYSNGVGSVLSPKGWPGSPGDGAYQSNLACTNNGDPCIAPFDVGCNGGVNGFCVHNPDWVMPTCAQDLPAIATPTLTYAWTTAAQDSCNTDDGTVKTMGGLILEVPIGAAGTYVIGFDGAPNNTFMAGGGGSPIQGVNLTPACITIGPDPPIRAPGVPGSYVKNRYISIDSRGEFQANPSTHHIRVRLDSSLVPDLITAGPWWATAPVNGQAPSPATCISIVTTTKPAAEPDWSGCPTVHLTGCPIVPTTTYAIAVEVDGVLSADALFDTMALAAGKWLGDCVGQFTGPPANVWTAPNGVAAIDDTVAVIKTFIDPNGINATHLSVTDLHPVMNGVQMTLVVNFNDVLLSIFGFQGRTYGQVADPNGGIPPNIPDLTECP